MNNVDTIMQLINWERSEEEQREGLAMARDLKCIRTFFQPSGPGYSKSVWENCARIICERSDDELRPYVFDMMLWLQDLNWPGAMKIQHRLMQFSDVRFIANTIDEMIPALIAVNEISWLMSIADLLDNSKLMEELSDASVQILSRFQR